MPHSPYHEYLLPPYDGRHTDKYYWTHKHKKDLGKKQSLYQRLASDNKNLRDRAMVSVKEWLETHLEVERRDYLKLWKALFFAVWHADKRPVQQNLAIDIAILINVVPEDNWLDWVTTFWETLLLNFEDLDKWRTDKYYQFVQLMFVEIFKSLRVRGWIPEEAYAVSHTITAVVPHTQNTGYAGRNLLRFTAKEMFTVYCNPQLKKKPRASQETIMQLLEPWILVTEFNQDKPFVDLIHNSLVLGAPKDLFGQLKSRILDSAGKKNIPRFNRTRFYDTVDGLEAAEKKTLGEPPLLLPLSETADPLPEPGQDSEPEQTKVEAPLDWEDQLQLSRKLRRKKEKRRKKERKRAFEAQKAGLDTETRPAKSAKIEAAEEKTKGA